VHAANANSAKAIVPARRAGVRAKFAVGFLIVVSGSSGQVDDE
jgi:hypothetical protein